MTLTNNAYLEVEVSGGDNATFAFEAGLQHNSSGSHSYLMGERGQYVREVVNATPGTGTVDASRRTGFWIDGGAGQWQETWDFEAGPETVQWGDTSGGTGQSNVTKDDASGEGVAAISRKNVFDYWMAKAKSDSSGAVKMHFGEWTDGTIAHVTGVSAGAWGRPMPLAINDWTVSTDVQEPGLATGQLTATHVALWGGVEAPDWAVDATDAIIGAADYIPDA